MTDIWDWYRERNEEAREPLIQFRNLIDDIIQEDKDLLEYFRQRD